jgi:hypothetical protein
MALKEEKRFVSFRLMNSVIFEGKYDPPTKYTIGRQGYAILQIASLIDFSSTRSNNR